MGNGRVVLVKTQVKLILLLIPPEAIEQSVVHVYRRVNWW
jgi:hypothetical protein